MSWTTTVQALAQFVVSGFGISIFGAILGWAGIQVATEHRWHALAYALAGGAITFGSAWAVTTFMQA
jgi:hypothetical protein